MHLDLLGYVVIERFVAEAACTEIRERLFDIEARFRSEGCFPPGIKALFGSSENYFRIDNLPHVAPCFHRYLTDPRIVCRAEDMVGGDVRLEQSDAHIRRPGAHESYGFHRGGRWNFGAIEHGLYYYPFVKALTNLSDQGPDDGGTAVIPGSHKLPPVAQAAAIEAALRNPALIHHVIAPAGSTVFIFESLLHSSGINRSGKVRPLILGGYTPPMFQAQGGYEPESWYLPTINDAERRLLSGSAGWEAQERYRDAPTPW
jgi:hypothetical protein